MIVDMHSIHPILIDCSDTVTYRSYSTEVEIKGQFIQDALDSLSGDKDKIQAALQQSRLVPLATRRWYKEQQFLDFLKDISEGIGPNALMQMGRKIPQILGFPKKVKSVEEAFMLLNELYQQQYLGARYNRYKIRRVSRQAVLVSCCHSYPCEMDMGILSSLAGCLEHIDPRVEHRNACKKNGSKYCTIMISYTV